jgi:hypothetical protein
MIKSDAAERQGEEGGSGCDWHSKAVTICSATLLQDKMTARAAQSAHGIQISETAEEHLVALPHDRVLKKAAVAAAVTVSAGSVT